jgi:molybdopterin-guanine dinucleotide biosynthesis protein A
LFRTSSQFSFSVLDTALITQTRQHKVSFSMSLIPQTAGIVLCGGLSSRMGRPKAWLPFGPDEVLLQRVVRILCQVVSPVVVVAAVGQELPALSAGVLIARDANEALGPVGGLSAGFAVLRGHAQAAYVSACDVPLLKPEVVRKICESLGDYDLAIPVEGQFQHPLAAAYRLSLGEQVHGLLATGKLRLSLLMEQARVLKIPVESLRDLDPGLDSFRNANSPDEYAEVLSLAAFATERCEATRADDAC